MRRAQNESGKAAFGDSLVGALDLGLVAGLFGGRDSRRSRVTYAAVGAAGPRRIPGPSALLQHPAQPVTSTCARWSRPRPLPARVVLIVLLVHEREQPRVQLERIRAWGQN